MPFTLQTALNLLAWLCAATVLGAWTTTSFITAGQDGDPGRRPVGGRLVGVGRVAQLLGMAACVGQALAPNHGSSTPWLVAAVFTLLGMAAGMLPAWEGGLYVLVTQAIALVAPIAAAESVAPRNQDLVGDADMVAAVALALVGGTWLLTRLLPRDELATPLVRARLRRLSTIAAAVVVPCNLVGLAFQHGNGLVTHDWWRLAQVAAALLMALCSWVPAAGLLGAAAGLLGVLAIWGSHVALPATAHERVAPDVAALGYSVAAWPTLAHLVTLWRINLLFAGLAVAAVTTYLALLAKLRRQGGTWPVGRTIAWVLGWLVVFLVTSSGVGRYAPVVFSVHMFMNLALNMLAAMLLCLGGFVTLVLRATPQRTDGRMGLHEWVEATMRSRLLGLLYHPIIALVFMTGTYYAFYLTSIFATSLHTHWLHQFVYLHFLVSGYIFYGLIIGVDQPPHPLPHIGKLGLIIGAMPFHAFFGVILMSKGTIFAQAFLDSLGHPWLAARGLLHDQWVGGTIAWAGGEFPLVIALAALVTQWKREDNKEGNLVDRGIDQGTDESYDAYNEMLAQLAQRDRESRAGR